MWALDEPSRASATVSSPLPLVGRTQKLVELSASADASALAA